MDHDQAGAGVSPPLFWTALLIAVAALSLPVLAIQYPPFNDYPFHFARSLIIAGPDRAAFGEFYDPGSWLLANLAQDMVVRGLSAFVPAATSVEIFLWLTLFLQLAGAVFLHRVAHGRLSVWPLATVVVIFNGVLIYGFLNFLFGVGLALFGMALWLRFSDRLWMLPLAGLLSCLLILCHLEAMGVFALGVAAIELERAWRSWRAGMPAGGVIRRLGTCSLPFVIPVLLFLLLSPTSTDLEQGFVYPAYLPGKLLFGPLFGLSTRLTWLDLTLALALAGLLLWALATRRLSLHRPLLWAAAVCGLAMLALPKYAMGSDFVDIRLAPVVAILLLLAVDIAPPRPTGGRSKDGTRYGTRHGGTGLALFVLGLVLLRTLGLTAQWRVWDREIATIVDDYQTIRPGAVVYAAVVGPGTQLIPNSAATRAAWRPPVKHTASYAVLAGTVFVPMSYVDPRKQPIRISPAYLEIKNLQGHNPFRVDRPEELAALVERLRRFSQDVPELAGRDLYLSVIGSGGSIDWQAPAGSALAARSPRQMLLQLSGIRGGS